VAVEQFFGRHQDGVYSLWVTLSSGSTTLRKVPRKVAELIFEAQGVPLHQAASTASAHCVVEVHTSPDPDEVVYRMEPLLREEMCSDAAYSRLLGAVAFANRLSWRD